MRREKDNYYQKSREEYEIDAEKRAKEKDGVLRPIKKILGKETKPMDIIHGQALKENQVFDNKAQEKASFIDELADTKEGQDFIDKYKVAEEVVRYFHSQKAIKEFGEDEANPHSGVPVNKSMINEYLKEKYPDYSADDIDIFLIKNSPHPYGMHKHEDLISLKNVKEAFEMYKSLLKQRAE